MKTLQFLLYVGLMLLVTTGSGKAQTCDITTPGSTPKVTWTYAPATTKSVTFSHSGGFSYHKIRIYDKNTPSIEYATHTIMSHTANTHTDTIQVPRGVNGTTVAAIVEVTQYDVMGDVVASDEVEIDLTTP